MTYGSNTMPAKQLPAVTSRAIDLLRFPLLVLVVYFHSFPLLLPLAADAGLWFRLAQLLAEQLARLAVPLLFICAGFLFFYQYVSGFAAYRQLWRKKSRTVLLPFLLWSVLGIACYAIGLSWQQTQPFFSNQPMLADFWTLAGFLRFWLGIERSPLVYPLWFLRDLLIFILISPVLARLLHWTGWWTGLVLLLMWLLQSWLRFCCDWLVWPLFQPALESSTFFVLGALFAIKPLPLSWLYRTGPGFVLVYLLGQLALWLDLLPTLLVVKVLLLIGITAVFYLALQLAQQPMWSRRLTVSAGATFFLFVSHEPLLTVSRKVLLMLLAPLSAGQYFLLYLLLPSAVMVLLLLCYRALATTWPSLCQLLTGGRVDARR